MTEMKFEEALKKLEKIIADLESGELSLDDSLKKYEEGINLARFCSNKLEAAQKKVEVLLKKGDKFELRPFDDQAAAEAAVESTPGQKKKKRSKKEEELF